MKTRTGLLITILFTATLNALSQGTVCWMGVEFADPGPFTGPSIGLSLTTKLCKGDTMLLAVFGGPGDGIISISPSQGIDISNTLRIKVYPSTSTTYTIRRTIPNIPCSVETSVRINVIEQVMIDAGNDTAICAGRSVQLKATGTLNNFRWEPSSLLFATQTQETVTKPLDQTTVFVVSSELGRCKGSDSIRVNVFPLPTIDAGVDTLVCINRKVQLQGRTSADSFYWKPHAFLQNPTSLQPIASPVTTTSFYFYGFNLTGCTEPVRDTDNVILVHQVKASAGNDISLVSGQPGQLQASGGNQYQWSPSTGLSNAAIANPSVILPPGIEMIKYKVRAFISSDCFGDDEVVVRYFKAPGIFIPNAFTPNADGRNDQLYPIVAGMKSLSHFKVFNRWGQEVFSTNTLGKGWDGYVRGQPQPTGVFVYFVEAVDFAGQKHQATGTVLLLR